MLGFLPLKSVYWLRRLAAGQVLHPYNRRPMPFLHLNLPVRWRSSIGKTARRPGRRGGEIRTSRRREAPFESRKRTSFCTTGFRLKSYSLDSIQHPFDEMI